MNTSAKEEGMIATHSSRHEETFGRGSLSPGSVLRLHAAIFAAAVAVLLILMTGAAQPALAQIESVLHSFTDYNTADPANSDGASPHGVLIMDSLGNLYGTTEYGGPSRDGTVFELLYNSPGHNYTEQVLYSFAGGPGDGMFPQAGLVRDSLGNLFGTTLEGGSSANCPQGCGTVFELSPPTQLGGNWTEKVLYSFTGVDGDQPNAGLIMDSTGNLYGTTSYGGPSYSITSSLGSGIVFQLTKSSGYTSEIVLYSFSGPDGGTPWGGVVMDSTGNLYGTTISGGSSSAGTVYELFPDSSSSSGYSERVLYNFTGSDGQFPYASLVKDSSGYLFSTTGYGGSPYSVSSLGHGTVFEVFPDASSSTGYSENVLHNFTGGNDGDTPFAGLAIDSSGNLYGTANSGGSSGYGTVFELVPDSSSSTGYSEKVLHDFTGGSDGGSSQAGLLLDTSGNLYGTAGGGGSSNAGVVFGIAPVTLSASNLSFGTVGVGTTSTAQTLTVTNNGGGNLNFGMASISGANAADFTIATDGCYSQAVGPGSSCSVNVTFTPSTATSETASLNLIEGGITITGSLTGTGALTTVGLSAASLTFPSQPVGTTSSARTVTLSNTGTVTLNIQSVGVTGDFAIDSNTCTVPVAAGKSCTVGVTFTPTAAGSLSGTLSFNDNAANSSQSVSLIGTGAITTVSLSPTSLRFGQQIVGTKSGDNIVTVTNTGASTNLAFSAISVSSNFVIDVATTCSTSTSVAPGGSCQVAVAFAPTTGGTLSGSLTLTDDASPATQTVALSGTSTAVSVSPSSLTFGSTVVGTTSSAETVTVTNTGTSGITFSDFTATGDFAVATTGTTCSTSTALAASADCTVEVTFAPTATGTQTGSLTIASNAGTGTVGLSGTGTAPGVMLSPSSLTLSGTIVGSTSSAQSVTLTNSGTSSLTITGITASGDFAINAAGTTCSTSATVAPSASCTISATFTPTAAGTRTGAVTITDNAGSSPQTVALSGTGEDFALAASTTSQTVPPGSAATYDLQLSPKGGFNQSVDLACSGAPAHAGCTVTPASVTLDGSSNASVSVKVSTAGSAMGVPDPGNFAPPSGGLPIDVWIALLGLLGLIAMAELSPKGGRVRRLAPFATIALLATLWAACGGGSSTMSSTTSSNATPAGTYTLTVTGTSGNLSHATIVTLKVQ